MEKFIDSTGQVLSVHNKGDCLGDNCPIHNPSNHHMKDWPLFWRDDRRIFERICEHGVGHPDPDDLNFRIKFKLENAKYASVHGCCGCCSNTKENL